MDGDASITTSASRSRSSSLRRPAVEAKSTVTSRVRRWSSAKSSGWACAPFGTRRTLDGHDARPEPGEHVGGEGARPQGGERDDRATGDAAGGADVAGGGSVATGPAHTPREHPAHVRLLAHAVHASPTSAARSDQRVGPAIADEAGDQLPDLRRGSPWGHLGAQPRRHQCDVVVTSQRQRDPPVCGSQETTGTSARDPAGRLPAEQIDSGRESSPAARATPDRPRGRRARSRGRASRSRRRTAPWPPDRSLGRHSRRTRAQRSPPRRRRPEGPTRPPTTASAPPTSPRHHVAVTGAGTARPGGVRLATYA